MQYKRKNLLSSSVVKKRSRIDPEKILFDNLHPIFGERFSKYREKYEQYLNNENYEHNFDYPISVILELVNRCNLECTMCYQGYRNDKEKETMLAWNLTAKTILHVNEWKNLFKSTQYSGDYYWFMP